MDKRIYEHNDINNPKYLFHGSPKKLDKIIPHQAHDSNGNEENEDYAVFLTSSFIIASAYAFKDKIKEISDDLDYNFNIGCTNDNDYFVDIENVRISDSIYGYIYVFPFDEAKVKYSGGAQYKYYGELEPIDVIKINFKDYRDKYNIKEGESTFINKI